MTIAGTMQTMKSAFAASETVAKTDPGLERKDYWTVPELLELMPSYNEIRDNFCGTDNWECRYSIGSALKSLRNGYGALALLMEHHFYVTEIDPSLGKMKVIYFDENNDYDTGKVGHFAITQFYAYWIEDGGASPLNPWSGMNYLDYAKAFYERDSLDSRVKIMVREDLKNRPAGWFTPNEEREYSFDFTPEIKDNIIYTYIDTEQGNNMRGTDYSVCADSAGFAGENIGCRAIVYQAPYGLELSFQAFDPTAVVEPVEEVKPTEPTETTPAETTPTTPDETIPAETKPSEEAKPVEEESKPAEEPKSPEETVLIEPAAPIEPSEPAAPAEPANSTDLAEQLIAALNSMGREPTAMQIAAQSTKTTNLAEVANPAETAETAATTAENDPTTDFSLPLGNETKTMGIVEKREADFPWWVFAIILPCAGILIGWFLPFKKREKTNVKTEN